MLNSSNSVIKPLLKSLMLLKMSNKCSYRLSCYQSCLMPQIAQMNSYEPLLASLQNGINDVNKMLTDKDVACVSVLLC